MRDCSINARSNGRAAFTLIEIMVAIGILAMVMVAIYSSWSVILQSAQRGKTAAAEAHRRRMTFNVLETALFGAQMYAANERYYGFVARTGGDFAELSLVSQLPEDFPGSGFYGNRRIRRVTFTVEEHEQLGNYLVMRQSPYLAITNNGSTGVPIKLARHLHHFTLEFWDERAAEWIPEWTTTNQLPERVRIELGINPPADVEGAEPRVYSHLVAVPNRRIPAQWQVPEAPFLNPQKTNAPSQDSPQRSDGNDASGAER